MPTKDPLWTESERAAEKYYRGSVSPLLETKEYAYAMGYYHAKKPKAPTRAVPAAIISEKRAGHVLIPVATAKMVDNVFLPSNPNKLRSACPEVVQAAKDFKALVAAC